VRDHAWTADAVMQSGRFLLRIDDRHWYGLQLEDGVVRAQARVGDLRQELRSLPVHDGGVVLRIASVPPASPAVPLGHAGPDDIVLSVDDGTGPRELARLDGRYLSTEVASGFTGRMIAVGSSESSARVRSVTYRAGAQE